MYELPDMIDTSPSRPVKIGYDGDLSRTFLNLRTHVQWKEHPTDNNYMYGVTSSFTLQQQRSILQPRQ